MPETPDPRSMPVAPTFRLESYRGFPVCVLEGEIDIDCRDQLEQLNQRVANPVLIVFDMTRVSYIDSTAIGWLVAWRRNPEVIILIGACERVRKIMNRAKLLAAFTVFESMEPIHHMLNRIVSIARSD